MQSNQEKHTVVEGWTYPQNALTCGKSHDNGIKPTTPTFEEFSRFVDRPSTHHYTVGKSLHFLSTRKSLTRRQERRALNKAKISRSFQGNSCHQGCIRQVDPAKQMDPKYQDPWVDRVNGCHSCDLQGSLVGVWPQFDPLVEYCPSGFMGEHWWLVLINGFMLITAGGNLHEVELPYAKI